MPHFDALKQNALADKFHALHRSKESLVLANAWDAASAKIIETSGFPAIATTSSGISWSCGYKDGEQIPSEIMLMALRRICRVVSIPVSADIEAGYAQGNLVLFGKFIENLIDAGLVGINLEDSHAHSGTLYAIEQQQELIRLARKLANQKGIRLFINARTDAMLCPVDLPTRIQICFERAKAYEQAGADGIFIPFVKDIETVALLKKNVSLPLNILMEDTLSIGALKALNVNRISTGSKPILAAMSLLKKITMEMQSTDDWSLFSKLETSYSEMNGYF